MNLTQYFDHRGLRPLRLNFCSNTHLAYALYSVIDELSLERLPEEQRNIQVQTYTYYCIFEIDAQNEQIKHIHTYLTESEALQLYEELSAKLV